MHRKNGSNNNTERKINKETKIIIIACLNCTKVLSESQSGYLVGNTLSLADVGLLECLLMTVDYFQEEPLQQHPHVKVGSHCN